ncbi:MAG: radical SAM family heme chaperone HemW [Chloroflexi bacterium]|nr:radical SAM family heme chaperone HemW [Chloroflexota bacterium]MCL5276119.1 radical SAM family heme chaperone HemW [Chloroflexota bacterium]
MKTGLYLHIPFCRSRCSYCDFNTYVGLNDLFEPYVRALQQEITMLRAQSLISDLQSPISALPAHTIFFGGGTPSLLKPEWIGDLIRACRETFEMPPDGEVTMECNPGSVDVDYLRGLRAQGVNRLSFGAQSADPAELKLLGREHAFADVGAAMSAARAAGFDSVNLDLIFGLPYQAPETWRRTMDAALALQPDHVSLYALTIEQGTPMYDWTRRGDVPCPDPDAAADMYDYAERAMGDAGFIHYEISNWCKPGRACEHNLIYWRNEPYYGFGAGAHSSSIRLRLPLSRRWWNVRRPADYVGRIQRGESVEMGHEDIDLATSRGETMMMGLRLLEEGVSPARFAKRYGMPLDQCYAGELREGMRLGLLDVSDACVRLTGRGHFLSNQALMLFVADPQH